MRNNNKDSHKSSKENTKESSLGGNFKLDQNLKRDERCMRVISLKTLKEFWAVHANAEQALKAWHTEAQKSQWRGPNDIKKYFPSADIIEGNRIIFNIKGNHYRLIVKIHYNTRIVYVRFVGTHAEYDKVNTKTI